MTGGAILRSRLVEEDGLSVDNFCQLMTLRAANSLMSAAQREGCAGLMIKQGRFPFHAVMALCAPGDLRLSELFPVNVLMTVFALRGRRLEVHIDQLGFRTGRLVAIHARHGAVRAQ